MADTGWLYGDNARNIDTGYTDWTDPLNAKVDDSNPATCSVINISYSDRLNVYTFGASIPGNATIIGILYSVERKASTVQLRDYEIYLMDNTAPKGNNKADTGSDWPTDYTHKEYGGSSDLWGTSWTPAQINASTFGLVVKCINNSENFNRTAYVEHLKVKIYYSIPSNVDHLMIMGM